MLFRCVSQNRGKEPTLHALTHLPGDPGGKVLDDHPVLGPSWGAVLVHPAGAAASAALAATARPAGVLNHDPG